MNVTQRLMTLALGALVVGGAIPAPAAQTNDGTSKEGSQASAPPVRYRSVNEPTHHVRIDGNSNVKRWHTTGARITGLIDFPAAWRLEGDKLHLDPDFTAQGPGHAGHASIPVLEIKGEEEGLSRKMHETMNATTHRLVTFDLAEVQSVSALPDGTGVRWDVRGRLTVTGVARDVDLTLTLIPQPGDRLQVELEKPLKMSQFQINPPTALGGFIRAHDDVGIQIRWILERHSPQPALPRVALPGPARPAINGLIDAYSELRHAVQASDRERIGEAARKAHGLLTALQGTDNPLLTSASEVLDQALRRIESAQSTDPMRTALAQTSQALKDLIALGGHTHESAVVVYRHANQEGIAAAEWLHVQQSATPAATPYSDSPPDRFPEIVAVYPPRPAFAP